MRAPGLIAVAFALSACTASEEGESNASLSDIENVSGLQVDRSDPAPVPPPKLEPLDRAEIEKELPSGAGCDLSRDGQLLLVAVGEKAIAKSGGRILHLDAEGPVEPNGGFFASSEVRVSIGRASAAGRTLEETTSWPARAAISTPASDIPDEIDAIWTCGA